MGPRSNAALPNSRSDNEPDKHAAMNLDIQSKLRRDFPPADFPAAVAAFHRWDAERKGLLDDRELVVLFTLPMATWAA
jgi:hypothetical protein